MNSKLIIIAAVLLVFAFLRIFYGLGDAPLEKWDERTNAQVVSELVSADTFPYLTHLGDPFFEKPPLWYYLTAVPVQIAGRNLFTLRVVSALSGFLLLYAVWKISFHWYGEAGGVASVAVLLSTNQLFMQNAGGYFSSHTLRSADSDSLLILFMTLALYCFGEAARGRGVSGIWGFLWSGLAVMTKGLVGILPASIYIIYTAFQPSAKKSLAKGLGVFFIIVFPWYVLMTAVYGTEFLAEHFGYHVGSRIVTTLEGHAQPWWFYVGVLTNKQVFWGFEILLISSIFLLEIKQGFREYRTFAPVAMCVSLLLLVTVTRTKLAWYVLPVYPFAALVIGNAVQELYARGKRVLSIK